MSESGRSSGSGRSQIPKQRGHRSLIAMLVIVSPPMR